MGAEMNRVNLNYSIIFPIYGKAWSATRKLYYLTAKIKVIVR
jgi:hypothetical protein